MKQTSPKTMNSTQNAGFGLKRQTLNKFKKHKNLENSDSDFSSSVNEDDDWGMNNTFMDGSKSNIMQ